jgi:hypothetical protein
MTSQDRFLDATRAVRPVQSIINQNHVRSSHSQLATITTIFEQMNRITGERKEVLPTSNKAEGLNRKNKMKRNTHT